MSDEEKNEVRQIVKSIVSDSKEYKVGKNYIEFVRLVSKAPMSNKESITKKLTEEDDKIEPPTKPDVSRDVKDLIIKAKSALNDGEYGEAAICVDKLAKIQDIVPLDIEIDREAEHEMAAGAAPMSDEVVEGRLVCPKCGADVRRWGNTYRCTKCGWSGSNPKEVEKPIESKVDEEVIGEKKDLKDMLDGELEDIMASLKEYNGIFPSDKDMKNSLDMIKAEIERRKEEEKD